MKKSMLIALALGLTLVAGTAAAQPAPVNQAGVTMGHWHIASKDVEANKKLFVAMGGKLFMPGGQPLIMFPGLYISLVLGNEKGDGGSVGSVVNHVGFIVDKLEFSCLRSEPLRERLHELRRQGRPQVVIGGIEAHVCVLQTAIDLEAQGFEAFVVADAIGSRSKVNRKLAMNRLMNAGVDVVDSEMVLFEWLERAGTPEFKDIQALIK